MFTVTRWKLQKVTVSLRGYESVELDLGQECSRESDPCTVEMFRLSRLNVEVSHPRRGPMADVTVKIKAVEPWEAHGNDQEGWSAGTNAKGMCTFELPSSKSLTIDLVGHDESLLFRHPALLQLQAGEERDLRLTVNDDHTIEGIVLDQYGKPQPHLEIWRLPTSVGRYFEEDMDVAMNCRTRSDSMGRFLLKGVQVGAWLIGPAPEGERAFNAPVAPLATEVLVFPHVETQTVTLTVWRGLSISGEVRGPDRESLPGVWVVASCGDTYISCQSVGDGTFTIGPIGPGPYMLRASGVRGYASSVAKEANAGDAGVVLELRYGGTVSGTVWDSNGHEVHGAQVVMTNEDYAEQNTRCTTNERGCFRMSGLVPGRYQLIASKSGELAWHRDTLITAGKESTGLDLRLAPGARVRLFVEGTENTDLEWRLGVDGTEIMRASLGRQGRGEAVVPPGQLEVAVLRNNMMHQEILLAQQALTVVALGEYVVRLAVGSFATK